MNFINFKKDPSKTLLTKEKITFIPFSDNWSKITVASFYLI